MEICFIRPSTFCEIPFYLELKNEGIPGAEETLINMTDELVRQGILVTVFTNVTTSRSYHNGRLQWRPLSHMSKDLYFHTVIFWTDTIADIELYISTIPSSKYRIVRVVNQMPEPELKKVLSYFDYALSQSRWFSSKYPLLQTPKTIFLPNGVFPFEFSRSEYSKLPNRVFYGSDYDRGLVYLLQLWPEMLKINPDLTLHICYGWDIYDKKIERCTQSSIQEQMIQFKSYISHLMLQPGIKHLGRISHSDVNEQLSEASLWLYPCVFPENCSTLSLKAQAARCLPVIIPSGGLDESVYMGFKTTTRLWDRDGHSSSNLKPALNQWRDLVFKVLSTDFSLLRPVLDYNQQRIFLQHSYSSLTIKLISALSD